MKTWIYEEWQKELALDLFKIGSVKNIDISLLVYEWCIDWCEYLNQFCSNQEILHAHLIFNGSNSNPTKWKLNINLKSKIQIWVEIKDNNGNERLPLIIDLDFKQDSKEVVRLYIKSTVSYESKPNEALDPYEWCGMLITERMLKRDLLMDKLNHELISYTRWLNGDLDEEELSCLN